MCVFKIYFKLRIVFLVKLKRKILKRVHSVVANVSNLLSIWVL